eukprot:CAMPEP_0171344146 /NCGR_PEP_ID=MMETSP0878-20121228/18738_1 /TAXON_ID=67004 /ORGANISM="Thalassiosira weissflogii, Strain CCMP1336" /LENGTH=88 /DNA_ID=CAMNT_0011847263 /DNA_START=115 /DNA_END=377 /DNA_ORIENTATION=+
MQLFGVDIGTVIESLARPSSHDNHNHDDNEADSPLGGGDILCCGGSGGSGIRFPFNFAPNNESAETTTMTMRQRRGGDGDDGALGRGG